MKSKHTPGPWILKNEYHGFVDDYDNQNGFEFKQVTLMSQDDHVLGEVKAMKTLNFLQDFDQYAANAKLIAAAPDLLEALQNMLTTITNIGYGSGTVIDKAKAAIKKATDQ